MGRSSRAVLLLAFVAVAASCSGQHDSARRSVLDAGVSGRFGASRPHRVGSEEAVRNARSAFRAWQHEVDLRGRTAPHHRFDNLPPNQLRRRLAALARAHDFTIVRVELRRPRQLAPVVIVQTKHYLELARATASILHQIDPKVQTTDDRTGWRYEGFFFEAQDEHGVPFLAASNFWRGAHAGGGQWARSDPLFPFVRI